MDMESTGEKEAVTPSSEIDIKEEEEESTREKEAVTPSSEAGINKEPLLTDRQPQVEQIFIKRENLTDGQPEIEQIYVKEENVGLEIPEDRDGSDPLQVGKAERVSEEEASYPPDAPYIKQEPECLLEEEEANAIPGPSHIKIESGLQEPGCSSEAVSTIHIAVQDLPTGMGDTIQYTANKEASCSQKKGSQYLILTCTICEKTFANFQEQNHTEFPYCCSVCQKTFKTKSSFKYHFRQHSDLSPYRCDRCEKTYKYIVSLKTHHRVQTEERPYRCEWCRKAFESNRQLMVHCLVHTIKQPDIMCKMCHNHSPDAAL